MLLEGERGRRGNLSKKPSRSGEHKCRCLDGSCFSRSEKKPFSKAKKFFSLRLDAATLQGQGSADKKREVGVYRTRKEAVLRTLQTTRGGVCGTEICRTQSPFHHNLRV